MAVLTVDRWKLFCGFASDGSLGESIGITTTPLHTMAAMDLSWSAILHEVGWPLWRWPLRRCFADLCVQDFFFDRRRNGLSSLCMAVALQSARCYAVSQEFKREILHAYGISKENAEPMLRRAIVEEDL